MKFSAWVSITLVTLLVVNNYIFKNNAVGRDESLADLPVANLYIQETNIHLVLSKIASKYKVPIGLEVSPEDDLLKDSTITIQMGNGTLKDILNEVVNQKPFYTWEAKDGVINVFPKDGNRDPLLQAILETKLERFSIKEGTSRIKFRESVIKSSELQNILEANGVTSENEIFSTRDMTALGRGFSLDVSNTTVRLILNRVIKESETKYWIINRYGVNKQYLLLNL
jgi:hypothetical protein